jgi:hypothetical protein
VCEVYEGGSGIVLVLQYGNVETLADVLVFMI